MDLKKKSLINMKKLLLMFEGPVSNNKEKIYIATLPLGRPWQKLIY